jgi:hypothetical protein
MYLMWRSFSENFSLISQKLNELQGWKRACAGAKISCVMTLGIENQMFWDQLRQFWAFFGAGNRYYKVKSDGELKSEVRLVIFPLCHVKTGCGYDFTPYLKMSLEWRICWAGNCPHKSFQDAATNIYMNSRSKLLVLEKLGNESVGAFTVRISKQNLSLKFEVPQWCFCIALS